jgi:hypothetical protein
MNYIVNYTIPIATLVGTSIIITRKLGKASVKVEFKPV